MLFSVEFLGRRKLAKRKILKTKTKKIKNEKIQNDNNTDNSSLNAALRRLADCTPETRMPLKRFKFLQQQLSSSCTQSASAGVRPRD